MSFLNNVYPTCPPLMSDGRSQPTDYRSHNEVLKMMKGDLTRSYDFREKLQGSGLRDLEAGVRFNLCSSVPAGDIKLSNNIDLIVAKSDVLKSAFQPPSKNTAFFDAFKKASAAPVAAPVQAPILPPQIVSPPAPVQLPAPIESPIPTPVPVPPPEPAPVSFPQSNMVLPVEPTPETTLPVMQDISPALAQMQVTSEVTAPEMQINNTQEQVVSPITML